MVKNKFNLPKAESNFDKFKKLIKDVTKKPVQSVVIPLELIEYTGETQKAVFLARLLFLSDKGSKPNGYIWKSYPDWKKEIGLSESQVERIVKDFKKRDILEAKKMMAASKNSNASNTWHYRLKMNNFLADFKEFLLVRAEKNLGLEPSLSSDCITESTNIDLNFSEEKRRTLLEKFSFSEKEKEEDNVKEKDLSLTSYEDEFNSSDNYQSAADAAEAEWAADDEVPEFSGMEQDERIYLPLDFQPTLENKIWAVNSFSFKSPAQVTKRLIEYYTVENGKNIKKSLEGWQLQWRTFVETHKTIGASTYSFEDEHNEIKNELIWLIYDFITDSPKYLISYDEIYEEFCERRTFERSVLDDYLRTLLGRFIESYFDCYYDLKEYQQNSKWAERVDNEMLNYVKLCNYEDSTLLQIFEFLKSELIFTEEQINSNFLNNKGSIKELLRVCVKFRVLTVAGKYYHKPFNLIDSSVKSEEDKQKQIRKIESKLAESKVDSEQCETVMDSFNS